MKTYRVRFERDQSRQWIVTVPSVKGCHTYGRTIEQARRRIREALGLFVDDAAQAELVDDVRLPEVTAELAKVKQARTLAARHQAHAAAKTRHAARVLTRNLRLSVRDAGRVLGVSHQRIQQLVSGE